jgi:hypothetical protein
VLFCASASPISEDPYKQCHEKRQNKLLIYRLAAMDYRYGIWIARAPGG